MALHFVILHQNPGGGKSFLTLPGQIFRRKRGEDLPVWAALLVKPEKGCASLFQKLRSSFSEGTCFYTESLRQIRGCYASKELHPVIDLFKKSADATEARLAWERYRIDKLDWPRYDHLTREELHRALCDLLSAFIPNDLMTLDYRFYKTAEMVPRQTFTNLPDDSFTGKPRRGHRYNLCSIFLDELHNGVLRYGAWDGEEADMDEDDCLSSFFKKHYTSGDVSELDDFQFEILYRNVIAVLEEMHHSGASLDTKIVDGKACVLFDWPDVQYLFDIPGFRDHSHLVDSEPDYSLYGDSAYWVEYQWLHFSRRGKKFLLKPSIN